MIKTANTQIQKLPSLAPGTSELRLRLQPPRLLCISDGRSINLLPTLFRSAGATVIKQPGVQNPRPRRIDLRELLSNLDSTKQHIIKPPSSVKLYNIFVFTFYSTREQQYFVELLIGLKLVNFITIARQSRPSQIMHSIR